jgi:hypothetical protein
MGCFRIDLSWLKCLTFVHERLLIDSPIFLIPNFDLHLTFFHFLKSDDGFSLRGSHNRPWRD